MDIIQQKGQDTNVWSSRFFDYLKSILDRHMLQFEKSNQLSAFMADDKNLYNEDGSLTYEYQAWIKLFETFCMEHPIDKMLESEYSNCENRLEFLRGAKEYLAHRQELKEKYANCDNGEEWLNVAFDSDEKRKAFETLIDKELEQEISKGSTDNR